MNLQAPDSPKTVVFEPTFTTSSPVIVPATPEEFTTLVSIGTMNRRREETKRTRYDDDLLRVARYSRCQSIECSDGRSRSPRSTSGPVKIARESRPRKTVKETHYLPSIERGITQGSDVVDRRTLDELRFRLRTFHQTTYKHHWLQKNSNRDELERSQEYSK